MFGNEKPSGCETIATSSSCGCVENVKTPPKEISRESHSFLGFLRNTEAIEEWQLPRTSFGRAKNHAEKRIWRGTNGIPIGGERFCPQVATFLYN